MARLGRSYPAAQTRLTNADVINPAPNLSPLPTIQTHLQAVNRMAQVSLRRPLSTRLRPPQVISPAPNLSPLPVVKEAVYAVPRASQSSRLRPMSTRVRPPNAVNPTPNLFLPTIGQFYHQAVTKSYKQAQRTPDSTGYLNPVKIIAPTPNLFLPTVTVRLQALNRSVQSSRRRPLATRLTQVPYLFFPPSAVFLPTLSRVLDRSRHSNHANSTILRNKFTPSPSSLFLPTLGVHSQAITKAREAAKFKGQSRLLFPMHLLFAPANLSPLPTITTKLAALRRSTESNQRRPLSTELKPPQVTTPTSNLFLPTVTTKLQAIPAARRVRYEVKLFPAQVITNAPNLFLPTLGTHLQAGNRAAESSRRRPLATKLSQVPALYLGITPPFLPTLGRLQVAGRTALETQRHRYLGTRLLSPMHLVFVPPNPFLPTGATKLDAVNRLNVVRKSYRNSTKLLPPILTTASPLAPPLKMKLAVIATNQIIVRRYKSIVRLSSSVIVNPAPSLFLPTVVTRLQAIPAARRVRYLAKLFPATVINPVPGVFLPTVSTRLAGIETGRRDRRIFKNATKLRPPVVTNAAPNLFLPTTRVKLGAMAVNPVVIRRFKYRAVLLQPPVVNPFVPHHATGASIIFLTDGRIAIRLSPNVYMPL